MGLFVILQYSIGLRNRKELCGWERASLGSKEKMDGELLGQEYGEWGLADPILPRRTPNIKKMY